MASQRFRIDVVSPAGGSSSQKECSHATAAGATASFIDLFVDNAEIKSMQQLEDALAQLVIYIRDNYRLKVGGV